MFAIAAAICLLWFSLSVANQFPRATIWLQDRNPFELLPCWLFFCPTPLEVDVHLVFRVIRRDATATSWQEVSWRKQRSSIAGLWNPQLRFVSTLFGAISRFRSSQTADVSQSEPYSLLLEIVRTHSWQEEASFIQFAIMEDCALVRNRQPVLSLKSAVHPV